MSKKPKTTSPRYTEQAFCKFCRPAMRGYAEYRSTFPVDAEWIRLTGGECGECRLVMQVGESYWFFTQSSDDHPKRWGSAQQFRADEKAKADTEQLAYEADQLTIDDALDQVDETPATAT